MGLLKNLLIITSSCLSTIATSCQTSPNDPIPLNGEFALIIDISSLKDTSGIFKLRVGDKILLSKKDGNKLLFSTKMDEPRRANLMFYPHETLKKYPDKSMEEIAVKVTDYYMFFAHPGKHSITVGKQVRDSYVTNPSPEQIDFQQITKLDNDFQQNIVKENQNLLVGIRSAQNPVLRDSLQKVYQQKVLPSYIKYYNDVIINFIKTHPDSPTSLQQLEEYSYLPFARPQTLASLYDNLTNRIKALPTAKRIFNQIDYHSFSEKNLIGKKPPLFTLEDVNGKSISIGDFKNKIVLLEFWASWCGACRKDNPEIRKIYNKYHDKNFEIISISLDQHKKDWLEAVSKDKMSWTNLIDSAGIDGKTVGMFHLFAIPANFLIDKDGKIMAKDLDTSQLELHLSKIL